ncbi:MAG: branched-chain amino acid ABC transporter permease [Synergistaceae bacterium]|jgi:branched-chain amino acid transport system permease protein|nr:branched-chain amino acid ABC transporter permease [Synergistaceae bacterium]
MEPVLERSFIKENLSGVVFFLFAAAALAVPLFVRALFPLHILIMIFLYSTLGTSWNILSGYAGQISLGQSVFVGIGGYTSSVLFVHWGVSPWLGMIAGVILTVAFGWLIGKPCFRLSGRYFAIATMAVVQIAYIVITRWEFVGGARGVYFPLKNWGLRYFAFRAKVPYYYIAFGLMLFSFLVVFLIEKSHIGYYLKTIREDEDVARALGIDVPRYKSIAMAFSTMLAAMGGTFLAQYLLFADPDSLFMLSIPIMLLTVMGGTGSIFGPLIGAGVLIPVQEYARVAWSGSGEALDQIVYGLIIVVIVIWQPRGIIGIFDRFCRSEAGKKAEAFPGILEKGRAENGAS